MEKEGPGYDMHVGVWEFLPGQVWVVGKQTKRASLLEMRIELVCHTDHGGTHPGEDSELDA